MLDRRWMLFRATFLMAFAVAGSLTLRAQESTTGDTAPPSPSSGALATPPSGARQHRRGDDEGGGRPVFGRITAIDAKSIRVAKPDGSEQAVTITPKTEFRKDREQAALKDFKVGDGVLIRGEENADKTFTAQMVAGRSGNAGPNGGPNRQNPVGTLGKDFVIGEIKAIDAPSITVMRTDNVKQTFELNEDTSLRKGRESITMADIQVGDHVFAHGGLQDNQFVPKTVTVISPERWKQMQEMGVTSAAAGKSTQQNAPAGSASDKPAEPPH